MLKQLKLRAELKEKRAELEDLKEKREKLKTRTEELESALEEATEDEDLALVQNQIEELEEEVKNDDTDETISKTEERIAQIEAELSEMDERHKERGGKANETESKKERGNTMNRLQVRELLKTGEYYERAEVKQFYEQVRNIRSVTGEDLTVPEIVVNRVFDIMGDFATVYQLVDHVTASGTVRILLDTDTTPAEWMEMKGALPDGNVGTITNVSFDGYKIGKVVFVDNAILQDSIVNLDDYVTKKLARAIAIGLDKAIIVGEGETKKQPVGIVTSLNASHKVEVDAGGKLIDIVKPIGLIDTGEDAVGEIVAVMRRPTYYNHLLEYSINTDQSGNVVGKLPNITNPDMLGMRVVYNNFVPENSILYGDYKQYTLLQREAITIGKSEHYKFKDDQTTFLGKGRFDGKPVKADAFVLVTITQKTEEPKNDNGDDQGSGSETQKAAARSAK